MVEEIKQEALKIRSQGLSVFSAKVDKKVGYTIAVPQPNIAAIRIN